MKVSIFEFLLKVMLKQKKIKEVNAKNLTNVINDEKSKGRTPFMLLVTDLSSEVDALSLKQICSAEGIWFHLQGIELAALFATHVPVMLTPAKSCDSFTVCIDHWFGLNPISKKSPVWVWNITFFLLPLMNCMYPFFFFCRLSVNCLELFSNLDAIARIFST